MLWFQILSLHMSLLQCATTPKTAELGSTLCSPQVSAFQQLPIELGPIYLILAIFQISLTPDRPFLLEALILLLCLTAELTPARDRELPPDFLQRVSGHLGLGLLAPYHAFTQSKLNWKWPILLDIYSANYSTPCEFFLCAGTECG